MKKQDIFLSLGSNINNPKANLDKTIKILSAHQSVNICKTSKYYRTAPVDYLHQPEFINCAVWIKSALNIHKFYKLIKKIEKEMGTQKEFKNGPRVIDIDIIFYSDQVIMTSDLKIPHPKMHERKFVLVPLEELKPDFIHPELRLTVKELLENLPHNPLQYVEEYTKK